MNVIKDTSSMRSKRVIDAPKFRTEQEISTCNGIPANYRVEAKIIFLGGRIFFSKSICKIKVDPARVLIRCSTLQKGVSYNLQDVCPR